MMAEREREPGDGYITPSGEFIDLRDADRMVAWLRASDAPRAELVRQLWGLADECANRGFAAAVRSYGEAALGLLRDPEELGRHVVVLGVLLERTKDFTSAAAVYNEGLALPVTDPGTAYFLHNNLSFCQNQLGLHAEAEGMAKAAIGIDARRHNAFKNLGVALEGQGRLEEAAHALLKAVELYPADPRARRILEGLLRNAMRHGLDLREIEEEFGRLGGSSLGAPN